METNQAVTTLAALAQASRLDVFRLLVQAGADGMAAGKISAATGIAPSSLSFHLKELSHAQLLTQRQEGRFVIYSANFAAASALVAFLSAHCCDGQACEFSPSSPVSTSSPCSSLTE
jgi:DNA-binding transcriptional ArsR family regulator